MSAPRKGRRKTRKRNPHTQYGTFVAVWNEREDLEIPTSAPSSSSQEFQLPSSEGLLSAGPSLQSSQPLPAGQGPSPLQQPLQIPLPNILPQTLPHPAEPVSYIDNFTSSAQPHISIQMPSHYPTPQSSASPGDATEIHNAVDPGDSLGSVLNVAGGGYVSESPEAYISDLPPVFTLNTGDINTRSRHSHAETNITTFVNYLNEPTGLPPGRQSTRQRQFHFSGHPYARPRTAARVGGRTSPSGHDEFGDRSSNLLAPGPSYPGSSSQVPGPSIPTYPSPFRHLTQIDPLMMSTSTALPILSSGSNSSARAIHPTRIPDHSDSVTDPHSEGQPIRAPLSRRQAHHPYARPPAVAGISRREYHNNSANTMVPGPYNQFTSLFPTPAPSYLTLQQHDQPFLQDAGQNEARIMTSSPMALPLINPSSRISPSDLSGLWNEYPRDLDRWAQSSAYPRDLDEREHISVYSLPSSSGPDPITFYAHSRSPFPRIRTPSPPIHTVNQRQSPSSPLGGNREKQIS